MERMIEDSTGRPPKLRLIVQNSQSGVATQPRGECTADVARALALVRKRQREETEDSEKTARDKEAEDANKKRRLLKVRIRGKSKPESTR